jgi:hypothetical protein
MFSLFKRDTPVFRGHDGNFWPMADPPRRPGTGSLIEVHRVRAMQAIDVVGAPASAAPFLFRGI